MAAGVGGVSPNTSGAGQRSLCQSIAPAWAPCSPMAPSPLPSLPPRQAGLGSAWNNHVDLLVTSLSSGAGVDGSEPRRFSEPQKKKKKNPFSRVTPGCESLMGGRLSSRHGASLQLLV